LSFFSSELSQGRTEEGAHEALEASMERNFYGSKGACEKIHFHLLKKPAETSMVHVRTVYILLSAVVT
jgi:hypothetical protein